MLQRALLAKVVLALCDHRLRVLVPRPSTDKAGKGELVVLFLAILLLVAALPFSSYAPVSRQLGRLLLFLLRFPVPFNLPPYHTTNRPSDTCPTTLHS
jgi:hypothetical protein